MKRLALMAASIVMFCLALFFMTHGEPIGMIASLLVTAGTWPDSPERAK